MFCILTKTSAGGLRFMGPVSQPHLDEDSRYLVYSAVHPVLDVWDLITLRGGPASPASLIETVMDPAPISLGYCCISLLFCGVLPRKLAHRMRQKYFIFAYVSWFDWQSDSMQLGSLRGGLRWQLIVVLFLYCSVWFGWFSYIWTICLCRHKICFKPINMKAVNYWW